MLAYGVNWWNRASAQALSDSPLEFIDDTEALRAAAAAGEDVAVWASRLPEGLVAAAKGKVWRVEDGFVRSPGLGALFAPAYSLIFDSEGVYYDPTGPSGLETLLATAAFDPALTARAAAVRRRIVENAIGKYAFAATARPPATPDGRERVLVVGQVEDDASVRLGGGAVRTNLALLRAAREAAPDAYIVFKPHPDVLKAGRIGAVARADVLAFADAEWANLPIAAALDWADAVHTISSLAGFEALLREKAVVAHGRPFYTGWGLTRDWAEQSPRRGRVLALDELAAAALILYPRYLDPVTGAPAEVETLLTRIEAGWRDPYRGRPLWHRAAAAGKRTLGPLRRYFRSGD